MTSSRESGGDGAGPAVFTAGDREALKQLLLTRSFQFGEFILSSGKKSSYYFDGKQVTLHPRGALLTARAVLEKVRGRGVQAVGGPTIGADPMVGALGVVCALEGIDLGLFIVRKDQKQHGKRLRIEGRKIAPGEKVAVIDDVLTTGGSILTAVEAVREAGGEAVLAVVLVDRCEGGTETLEGQGIPVDPVFTVRDFGL
ncbi:MAG: orotate phosphoribosyltransferase [Bacillota bacterium]